MNIKQSIDKHLPLFVKEENTIIISNAGFKSLCFELAYSSQSNFLDRANNTYKGFKIVINDEYDFSSIPNNLKYTIEKI